MQLNLNNNSNINNNFITILHTNFYNKILSIDELLIFCTENKCSDLYVKIGHKPYISKYGKIYEVPCYETTNKIWNDWEKYAISSENNAKYVRSKMLDFAYTIHINNKNTEYRYRVSAGFSVGKSIATFRMISDELPSFNSMNFPKDLKSILEQIGRKRERITIFSGATGAGKTTTMSACINDFSKPGGPFENSVIISLEDPIEYIYNSSPSVNIVQKELGSDFKEFSLGVKQALREHPNFINVGETRDKETINTLVEASRTGHAVFTSFHAIDVADTISRLYNHLIGTNADIMYDLISSLNLICCQKLIPSDNGFKLVTQYMVFNDSIRRHLNECIEKGKNIPVVINELFKNEQLLKNGLVKDWN